MKRRHITLATAVLAVGLAPVVWINVPSAFAEDELPHCNDVRKYDRLSYEYTEVQSPINITSDEIASYVVPNHSDSHCKVEINLNGHTLSQAYAHANSRENIVIGKNVKVVINGDGGTLAYGTPEHDSSQPIAPSLSAIFVDGGSTLEIKDTKIDSHENSHSVYSYNGDVTLNNVEVKSLKNDGGELTINGGKYSGYILTFNEAKTTINNGTFTGSKIRGEVDSEIIVNGGTFNGDDYDSKKEASCDPVTSATCSNVNNVTDDDGNEYDANASETVEMTINNGVFNNFTFDSRVQINGGTFNNCTFKGIFASTYHDNIRDDNSIRKGVFNDSTFNSFTSVDGGTLKNTVFNGEVATDWYREDTGTERNNLESLENPRFTGKTTVNNSFNVQIWGGLFDDLVINTSTSILDGRFKNIHMADRTALIIQGGAVRNIEFGDNNTLNIIAGSFIQRPTEEMLHDEYTEIVENENGTFTVRRTIEDISSIGNYPEDIEWLLLADSNDVPGVPDTGSMFAFETSGKKVLLGASIIAGAAAIMAMIGKYIRSRVYARRSVEFKK